MSLDHVVKMWWFGVISNSLYQEKWSFVFVPPSPFVSDFKRIMFDPKNDIIKLEIENLINLIKWYG